MGGRSTAAGNQGESAVHGRHALTDASHCYLGCGLEQQNILNGIEEGRGGRGGEGSEREEGGEMENARQWDSHSSFPNSGH